MEFLYLGPHTPGQWYSAYGSCHHHHNRYAAPRTICYRCGFAHGHNVRCQAFGRRCLRCNGWNHYGRMCYTRLPYVSADFKEFQTKQQKRKKSPKKKTRDQQRLIKSVLQELPFSSLSDAELCLENFTNDHLQSELKHAKQNAILTVQVNRETISNLNSINNDLKNQLRSLESKFYVFQTQNSNLTKEILKASQIQTWSIAY